MESQQAEAAAGPQTPNAILTPDQMSRQRLREGLLLSRSRVLQEIEAAQQPGHREMLGKALAELDSRIAQLR